jgi:hypothetical protein
MDLEQRAFLEQGKVDENAGLDGPTVSHQNEQQHQKQ